MRGAGAKPEPGREQFNWTGPESPRRFWPGFTRCGLRRGLAMLGQTRDGDRHMEVGGEAGSWVAGGSCSLVVCDGQR